MTSVQSWTIYYNQESWWDDVPIRHGAGTNFSFADGHAEYWKWEDPRTLRYGRKEGDYLSLKAAGNNPDIRRVQQAAWGDLGYNVQ